VTAIGLAKICQQLTITLALQQRLTRQESRVVIEIECYEAFSKLEYNSELQLNFG
jgi:hypothetical protein